MAGDVLDRLQRRLAANPIGKDLLHRTFHVAPPCSEAIVNGVERDLGFALPPLLRRIYLEVANGGFGPGYGVMGVRGGFTDDLNQTADIAYRRFRNADPEDPLWTWPEGLLPICHWGCAIYSTVDCLRDDAPVSFVHAGDKEPDEPMSSIIIPHRPSLADWLTAWMDGVDLWSDA